MPALSCTSALWIVLGFALPARSAQDDPGDRGDVHAPAPPEPAPPLQSARAAGPVQPAHLAWLGTSVLGGTALAVDLDLRVTPALAIDVSVGPRFHLGADVHANLAGQVGLTLMEPYGHTHHGAFLRGGATLPLADWSESLAAVGYAVRIDGRREVSTSQGLDLGLGARAFAVLPEDYQANPFYAYLRYSVVFGLGS